MMKIIQALLTNSNGEIPDSIKQKILSGLDKTSIISVLSYPPYLLKHKVEHSVFPEAWDMIAEKLDFVDSEY